MDSHDYYEKKKTENFKQFDEYMSLVNELISRKYGDKFSRNISDEIKQEFEIIYTELPYIGGDNNPLTFNLISAAENLALYLVLKRHDKPLSEIGALSYKACEKLFEIHPELAPKSRPEFIPFIKKAAEKSKKEKYPEDWVYNFVESNGEFDYGLDFTECGIVKLFREYDADEFTPYLCAMDIIMSDASNAGLHRTETLAEGGKRCDFRYKSGRKTKIEINVIK